MQRMTKVHLYWVWNHPLEKLSLMCLLVAWFTILLKRIENFVQFRVWPDREQKSCKILLIICISWASALPKIIRSSTKSMELIAGHPGPRETPVSSALSCASCNFRDNSLIARTNKNRIAGSLALFLLSNGSCHTLLHWCWLRSVWKLHKVATIPLNTKACWLKDLRLKAVY